MSKKALWEPTRKRIKNSNMKKFMDFVNSRLYTEIQDYYALYEWSVREIEDFWESVWLFGNFEHSNAPDRILERPETEGTEMFGAKWFQGAELNFAENLLRFRDEHKAVISRNEQGNQRELTYNELFNEVAKCAAGLRKLGVQKGDRVAGYISNIPEAIIAMLATSSIGAIWSSTSPDFGSGGVLGRFGQIRPKVLFAVDGYRYNKQDYDRMDNIRELSHEIPEIEKIVIIPQLDGSHELDENMIYWDELTGNDADSIEFEQLPFDHPLYIMYSSGTTGTPKCIVHGQGGTLLQHFKELHLHTNLTRDDVIFFFTTCGWMMWNWLLSSLNIGATIFLYEGSPFYPNPYNLWKAVEELGITIFGTSPKFLTASEKTNTKPAEKHDLSTLDTILSTGAPLTKDNFKYVYEKIKADVQLSSISGGTDIVSCFMLGNPTLPVFSEEIQCRGLGMAVEAYDENGKAKLGKKGELVCTKPFVSMPVYFWNDPGGVKYWEAYFDHFPGIWTHGDYIKVTRNGGVIVYGRSDATLNPGGVRIGTAEIYRIVEAMDEIQDSIVVGQKWKGDTRVMLFVVMKEGRQLTDDLKITIKKAIKAGLTPRHVPDKIHEIDQVPMTLNGKKVELAVTNVLNGEDVTNRAALANPEALEQFEKYRAG